MMWLSGRELQAKGVIKIVTKRRSWWRFIIFGFILAGPFPVDAPHLYCRAGMQEDRGIKYTRNYSRKDYNNESQNWSIVQDKRGIIYAGNQGGVMEFDGVSWREIPVPNKTARSLAVADNGIIYVGGMDEIGFLAPDTGQKLQYVSLIPQLDKQYRDFSYVWRTHAAKDGVYFCTSKFLFLWNGNRIKTWTANPGTSFSPPFLCAGKLYTRQKDAGLLVLENNAFESIPGGKEFASKKIYMMANFEPGKILIGAQTDGFYLYDGEKATPFAADRLKVVNEYYLTHGIRLSSGDFALATFRGGLFIIDNRGSVKHVFDKSSGLQDNTVWFVFEDFQGNLWLALDRGITKIEAASPFSIYDETHSNLPGQVLSATRHGPGNTLYAGSTTGLYYLTDTGKFLQAPGISGECRSLLSTGDSLLAAASTGIFQVEKNGNRLIVKEHTYVLHQSRSNPNRIWAGQMNGLASLVRSNENDGNAQWTLEQRFENISREIMTIAEDANQDKNGDLWLGTLTNGVLKVAFSPGAPGAPGGALQPPVVTVYDQANGLPPDAVYVFRAAGHIMFATPKGIFRFNEKNKTFVPDTTLGEEFAGGENGRSVFYIVEDTNKHIWFHSKSRNILAVPRPDGTYQLYKKPFLRIPLTQVNDFYPDGDVAWFASLDGLIRFDTGVKKNCDLDFQALIRKVLVDGTPVFNGYKGYKREKDPGDRFPLMPVMPVMPVIHYKNRNLRFHFAAPFFEAESETLYQCFLEGYDSRWTAWTGERWKDYTNLDAGVHKFRVRAKNVYGNIGREDSFQFKIPPPWYNTWWAISIYALAAVFMVFLIVKGRSRKLLKEKQILEQIIDQRTKEIKDKNLQLEEQSEKLEEMDKIKSRFFANISHEFRTPLTLIMGPLEKMLSRYREKEEEKDLKLMLRSSRRLLGLINQLLELSKFDSGKVQLEVSRQNPVTFLKGITASFEILADRRELDLRFRAEEEDITLYIDLAKMEEVMCNLLGNAVKFTPAGGRIIVSVKTSPENVEISVADTGPGIPPEDMAHIFDRFYQADSTHEHHRKGSGIGLAIAKELVELHGGEISVRSIEGEGTEFIIRLPRVPADVKGGVPADYKQKERAYEPVFDVDSEEEEKEEPGPETLTTADADGKHMVLVVEDSADMRAYIRGTLEPFYTVVNAVDGKEGIEKAREFIPDLIISDIMMPGVDGCELCRVLKSARETSHIPIILLTAKASEANILEGLETGADDYITKPFSTRILCARIKNLIDLRRHLQETLNREMTFQPAKISVSPIDKEFLHDLQAVIDENITEPDFNVEDLSKKLYMGRTTLYRKILALSGESPTDFIRSYRLKQGAELLKKKNISVLEAAFEVGFSSANYFSKCFKKKFHQLPTTFKETELS